MDFLFLSNCKIISYRFIIVGFRRCRSINFVKKIKKYMCFFWLFLGFF